MTDEEIAEAEFQAADRVNRRALEDGWDAETRTLAVRAARRYAVSPEIRFEQIRRQYAPSPNRDVSRI